ncbi:MAG: hypothetical protein K2W82_17675 [Candidatus Obscuribacterales bacterium]|nr:hypothetical protein [Candidatus Obscuribacterales bacterium]
MYKLLLSALGAIFAAGILAAPVFAAPPANNWGQKQLPPIPADLVQQKHGEMPGFAGPLPNPPQADRKNYAVPQLLLIPVPVPHNCRYHAGFYVNGRAHSEEFFAYDYFCPTPYFYNINSRFWWGQGQGFSWTAPAVKPAMITVVVTEIIDVQFIDDASGTLLSYPLPTLWYYNAYAAGDTYVYQDYRGVYKSLSW